MKTILINFVLVFSAFIVAAQDYAASLIPDSLFENAHEVIREKHLHFEVKSDKEGVIFYRKVVTVLNEKSDAASFYVGYNAESKIRKVSARIYDAFGKEVRKVSKEEFKDYAAIDNVSIYQDNRIKTVNLSYSEYPYTIVYEYEKLVKGIDFAVFPRWKVQEYNQSVIQSALTIEIPNDIALHYKALNTALKPTLKEDNGHSIYHWQAGMRKAIPAESYGPYSYQVLPCVLTAPGRFKIRNYTGSMADWESFGRFILQLQDGRKTLPGTISKEVHQIVDSLTNNEEKIDALYRYMQQQMRYVSVQLGIGGWQPFSAQYVAENKYGDCKALSNFMHSILKEAGIESFPALVMADDLVYEIDSTFTTPFFNHQILYVPEEDIWLECTSNNKPTGYLGSFTHGRNTLLITPQGGRIAATPTLNATHNTSINHNTIVLLADGSAKVVGKGSYNGIPHEWYRGCEHQLAEEECEKQWLKYKGMPGISIYEFDISTDKDSPTAGLKYNGLVRRYASKAGKRLFVPINTINRSKRIPPDDQARINPIVLRTAYTDIDSIIITLPEGYQVESLNEDPISISSDFGHYEFSLKLENGVLICHRMLRQNSGTFPASTYEDFRNFYLQIAKVDKSVLVLVEKKT